MSRRRFRLRLLVIPGVLALAFVVLRVISFLPEPAQPIAFATEKLVVVGTTGPTRPEQMDLAAALDRSDQLQIGSVSVRPRFVGDCAAAGWTTLGAGRRAGVGGLCDPQVVGGRITDWADRVTAAAADRGDARLGLLAEHARGCVAAVGPGAALAAARPDGSVAQYQTVEAFLSNPSSACPLTLVDPGPRSREVVSRLSGESGEPDPDVTLLVTGIGPDHGAPDPGLQLVYRLGTTFPGWLTSASTRRTGIVTLTDLTRTLVEFGQPAGYAPPTQIDGSPLQVEVEPLSSAAVVDRLAATRALSDAMPRIYRAMGIGGAVVALILVVGTVRRRPRPVGLGTVFAACLPSAMMLTGASSWPSSATPATYASLVVTGLTVALTGAVLALARWRDLPAMVVALGLAVTVFTAEAALGAPMEPGSLLNSRPVNALRWYGFGNSTFASYATPGLVLAGYLAHRSRLAGRNREALAAVALLGFGIVVCEGWPSMGADFGGVVALAPAVLWLLFALSGIQMTASRWAAVAGSAVVAAGLISGLDWARGPDRRSHLGNFVQRIIDGDALDVVARKATASLDTVMSGWGLVALVFGVAAWLLIFRVVVPAVRDDPGNSFSTIGPTMVAVLIVGVLGTVLNDAGIWVWAFVAGVALFPALWFWARTWPPPAEPSAG